jgi:hypothetical protein
MRKTPVVERKENTMNKRMLALTFFGLMLTPVFYAAVQAVLERRRRAAQAAFADSEKVEAGIYA